MKATVDHDICIGCGLCASLCSEIFELNDEGLADSTVTIISEDLIACAEDAKDSCPVNAIEIE
ncbi:ferredoxin [Clostridium sp.]|uniref:ferredoxin n=1 Tax=Clostridium sp. TaxID=1506 RepID=UPI003F3B37A7